jgi:hypothetical protein
VGDTLNHEEEILSFFVGVVLVQLIQVDDYDMIEKQMEDPISIYVYCRSLE